jgi:hypothetical protein
VDPGHAPGKPCTAAHQSVYSSVICPKAEGKVLLRAAYRLLILIPVL